MQILPSTIFVDPIWDLELGAETRGHSRTSNDGKLLAKQPIAKPGGVIRRQKRQEPEVESGEQTKPGKRSVDAIQL